MHVAAKVDLDFLSISNQAMIVAVVRREVVHKDISPILVQVKDHRLAVSLKRMSIVMISC